MTRQFMWLILLSYFIISSCKKPSTIVPTSESIEMIMVDAVGKQYLSTELFSDCKIIELETTEESYFASIGRVYRDSCYIYILDDRLHSVLLFDKTGKFVRKIHKIGRGPGEYIQLSDITIDENGFLFLMADIPEKAIVQSNNGTLIEQILLDEAYMEVCSIRDSLVFINPPTSKTSFSILNKKTGMITSCMKAIHAYNSFYMHGRSMTMTNQQILLTRRFDNNIYSFDGQLIKSAEISFNGNKFITETELQEYGESSLFFDFCRKNNRVFSVVDCQQLANVWVFNTNLPYCYFYSCDTGKQYVVSDIVDEKNHIQLGGFSRIAVNGDNNNEVCFVLREDGLKQIGKSEIDNPVLLFYTLRKDI